jgi:hypothetical protein
MCCLASIPLAHTFLQPFAIRMMESKMNSMAIDHEQERIRLERLKLTCGPPRECEVCQTPYQPVRQAQLYCSPGCKAAAFHARRREHKEKRAAAGGKPNRQQATPPVAPHVTPPTPVKGMILDPRHRASLSPAQRAAIENIERRKELSADAQYGIVRALLKAGSLKPKSLHKENLLHDRRRSIQAK